MASLLRSWPACRRPCDARPVVYELDPAIAAHDAHGVDHDRLAGRARIEAERTRELLARHLPPVPALVVDVGGAEGAYALPLAAQGYEVHLLDPYPSHVEAARAATARTGAALASAGVGDARALPYDDRRAAAWAAVPTGRGG